MPLFGSGPTRSGWWPLDGYSVYGGAGSVAFEDGALVERGADGAQALWGTVLEWSPGATLRMTWHPGGDPEHATEVEVRFSPVAVHGRDGVGTLVELVHSGWERHPQPEAARAEYGGGWTGVIERYAATTHPDAAPTGTATDGRTDRSDQQTGPDETWIVLRHSAGWAAGDGPVLDHPDFAEHAAFLGRLQGKGVLVAAGPLGGFGEKPTGATGMTVLRVPTADVEAFLELAREDDRSVTRGLLDVDPVRWNVVVTG